MQFFVTNVPWSYDKLTAQNWHYHQTCSKSTSMVFMPWVKRVNDQYVAESFYDAEGNLLPKGKYSVWIKPASKSRVGMPIFTVFLLFSALVWVLFVCNKALGS